MIRLEDISVCYNQGMASEVTALDKLNLKIKEGTFTLVIGSNGSGKSTLLNILAGSLIPDQGRILFNESEIQHLPDYRRSNFVARVFQDPAIGTAQDLSLLENFRLASLRGLRKKIRNGLSSKFRMEIAETVAELQMGLEKRLDEPMRTFSGGQRQAISLLMATYRPSDLLLMDEPTAALDPRSASLVFSLAMKLIKEKRITCLMVTHELKYCMESVDRVIQFSEGKVLRDINKRERKDLDIIELASWFS